jgi:hypothetical protein
MGFCINCGSSQSETAIFCANCGKRILADREESKDLVQPTSEENRAPENYRNQILKPSPPTKKMVSGPGSNFKRDFEEKTRKSKSRTSYSVRPIFWIPAIILFLILFVVGELRLMGGSSTPAVQTDVLPSHLSQAYVNSVYDFGSKLYRLGNAGGMDWRSGITSTPQNDPTNPKSDFSFLAMDQTSTKECWVYFYSDATSAISDAKFSKTKFNPEISIKSSRYNFSLLVAGFMHGPAKQSLDLSGANTCAAYVKSVLNQTISNPSPAPATPTKPSPSPTGGIDLSTLPQAIDVTSAAYQTGMQQAQAFIDSSALTRAIYDELGGLVPSCKYVLDSFLAYYGGSSTNQQYADFLGGCQEVVKSWY